MTYNLLDLNDETRRRMLSEFEADVAAHSVFESAVVASSRNADYIEAQRRAFLGGDPDTLAAEIEMSGMLVETQSNGARVNASAAAKRLSGGQFGAYYARAVSDLAIDKGVDIEIYRARVSSNPRANSDAKVGQRPDPERLRDDLRLNSTTPGEFSILPEVGSGLTIKLVE